MPIAGTPGPQTDAQGSRRRTREQRRNRRSGAFDLLAVVAALALVGLGLANLYLIGATELAVRQGVNAAVGTVPLPAVSAVVVIAVLDQPAAAASPPLSVGSCLPGPTG